MRNILIDITRLLDRKLQGRLPTGIDRVSMEYLRHFGQRSTALVYYRGRWIELSPQDSERMFEVLLGEDHATARNLRWQVGKAAWRSFDQRFDQPRFLFNTGHTGLETPQYAQSIRNSALKPLFLVHDLIPLLYPEYCRPGAAENHRQRLNTMIGTGAGLIANSAHTLNQLGVYAEANGLRLPPTVTALLAPGPLPAANAAPPITGRYFVVLGTIEPRKNHWMLLQIWRRLIEQHGAAAPRLVVIGQRGWECQEVVDMMERCEQLQDFVVEVPRCSDQDLANWFHHAQALLFPSFAEGYGMPVIEALMQGLPVIASELETFREFAGNVPEYIDPIDGLRWLEMIAAYSLTDCPAREQQLTRMQNFRIPTWEAHFEQVETLMTQLE